METTESKSLTMIIESILHFAKEARGYLSTRLSFRSSEIVSLRDQLSNIALLSRNSRSSILRELASLLHAIELQQSTVPIVALWKLLFEFCFIRRSKQEHRQQIVPGHEHEVRETDFVSDEVWSTGTIEMGIHNAENPFDLGGVAFLCAGQMFVVEL